ncbi:MAG: hypothetical protein COB15_09985 [Flavobacteriales bacterium]|nr:MAG: hypothetical protein COB15_09985 [Flavobacteriales bacterium]
MKTSLFKKGYLCNMVLPFIFFEWWYVLLSFIFVVLLESYVIKLFLKKSFKDLFKILFYANLVTTLAGYLFQGLFRIILSIIIWLVTGQDFSSYPITRAMLGGTEIPKGVDPQLSIEVLVTIITSIIIAFTLSVIIERKFLVNKIGKSIDKSLITKSIIVANLISYTLLTFWLFYNFLKL